MPEAFSASLLSRDRAPADPRETPCYDQEQEADLTI